MELAQAFIRNWCLKTIEKAKGKEAKTKVWKILNPISISFEKSDEVILLFGKPDWFSQYHFWVFILPPQKLIGTKTWNPHECLLFVFRHFLLPVFMMHAGFDPVQEAMRSRTLQAPSLCIAPRKTEETILPRKREKHTAQSPQSWIQARFYYLDRLWIWCWTHYSNAPKIDMIEICRR